MHTLNNWLLVEVHRQHIKLKSEAAAAAAAATAAAALDCSNIRR
jgi:hypothetical protein